MKRKWQEYEIKYLKENFKYKKCWEIAKDLGRTEKSVQHKFGQLKLNRMPKINDTINYLTIKSMYEKNIGSQFKTRAKCECICGKIVDVLLSSVIQEKTKSCGCYKIKINSITASKLNYKHGLGNLNNRLYRIWTAMRCRCNNPNIKQWMDYGGRGIRVCKEWDNFITFMKWALSNGYSDSLSIDRIDVNGNYCPENCRWATASQQRRNCRDNRMDTIKFTAFGETKSVFDWINDERCVLDRPSALYYRIGTGWNPELAITKPSKRSSK